MAEWGNPGGWKTAHPSPESIGAGGKTQGTEPSQYLEEKKSRQRFPQ